MKTKLNANLNGNVAADLKAGMVRGGDQGARWVALCLIAGVLIELWRVWAR